MSLYLPIISQVMLGLQCFSQLTWHVVIGATLLLLGSIIDITFIMHQS